MENSYFTIVCAKENRGICNLLKNLLSCIRIKEKFGCNFFVEDYLFKDDIFNLSMYTKKRRCNYRNIVRRKSWRLAIFDSDENLDKVIDNKYSLMFKDFVDKKIYKNYKNNCIDLLYNHELFSKIYQNYSELFNSLDINDKVLVEVNNFYDKFFNKNTISLHIRTWVDRAEHERCFDIKNFYREIDILDVGENNFFVSSDDKKICYEIKKYQEEKGRNNVIIYENNNMSSSKTALIELILLSKNNILIGTEISTFTEMAFIINYNTNKKIINVIS